MNKHVNFELSIFNQVLKALILFNTLSYFDRIQIKRFPLEQVLQHSVEQII